MAKDPIIVDPDPIREIQKAINNIRKEFGGIQPTHMLTPLGEIPISKENIESILSFVGKWQDTM